MNRVVVTGMGAITPIGNTLRTFLDGLRNGTSGARTITLFDASSFKTQFACEVRDFDPQLHFDRKQARKMDRFTQFAMIAAHEAIDHAGLDFEQIDLDRAGVIWGSGIGGLRSLEEEIEQNEPGHVPRYSPFMINKMIANMAPGLISIKYGLRGVNFSTVSACASSSHSILSALDDIRLGRSDVIIVGGSEAAITRAGIGGFSSMKAMSRRNEEPAKASRPFDLERDGFVLGEGGGCLILESEQHAQSRGANILAELAGGAQTSDAYHMTAPHPEGTGVIQVMNNALTDAGMNRVDINHINTHGTSTPLGDVAELGAIRQVFGNHANVMGINSTKSMTGHLLGAAGAIEAIASVLALEHNFIPPTINHSTPDPAIDNQMNLILNEAVEQPIEAVMSNTFGFGGHNATIIFRQYKAA